MIQLFESVSGRRSERESSFGAWGLGCAAEFDNVSV